MNQFVDMLKEFIWWVILIAIFILFLTYYNSLEYLSKMTVIVMGLLAVVWGASYSFTRYVRLTRSYGHSTEEQNQECVRWTAKADFQYNLLAWITFIIIIAIGELSNPSSSAYNLAQAFTAFVALMGGKKLFIKKFYSSES